MTSRKLLSGSARAAVKQAYGPPVVPPGVFGTVPVGVLLLG